MSWSEFDITDLDFLYQWALPPLIGTASRARTMAEEIYSEIASRALHEDDDAEAWMRYYQNERIWDR